MRNTASFSVRKALSESLGGLPDAWKGAGLALLLLWGAAIGGPLAATTYCSLLLCAAVVVILGLLKILALGALYRISLFGKDARKEGLGPGGLQAGPPEARLTVATLIAGLFIVMIAVAAFIVFAIIMKMYGLEAHEKPSGFALVAMIAGALLMAFVALKFSLLHAANIAQRRLVTLNALGLTSGYVGRLFVGIAVLCVPFVLLCGLVLYQFAPEIRLAHALPQGWLNDRMNLILFGGLMLLCVGGLLPLLSGFFASAYRQITQLRAS